MPKPNRWLIDLGLLESWHLPSEAAMRVFTHLCEPGEPRLFIRRTDSGGQSCAVSNSESAPGWSTQIDARRYVEEKLLELDPELTAICVRSVQAYRISAKGRETVAQFYAHRAYRELLKREIPRIIEEQRRKYGAVN